MDECSSKAEPKAASLSDIMMDEMQGLESALDDLCSSTDSMNTKLVGNVFGENPCSAIQNDVKDQSGQINLVTSAISRCRNKVFFVKENIEAHL